MVNLIRLISTVVTPLGSSTQTTVSYPIGVLGSHVLFNSSLDFKTNTYLPCFNDNGEDENNPAAETDSITKVSLNIITKLKDLNTTVSNLNTTINSLDNSVSNLDTTITGLNTSVNNQQSYFNSLVNNSSIRLSLTNPWGQNIYLNSVATSSANATSSMAGGNSLGQLAGKFNYLRSHPFIIIRYRYKDLFLTKNTPTLVTFGKKAVEEILVPNGNVLKSVSTSSINLDNYVLQVAFSPLVNVGNADAKTTINQTATAITKSTSTTSLSVVPQRSFILNNADDTRQYVCAGAWASGNVTINLNVRVIATLKQ